MRTTKSNYAKKSYASRNPKKTSKKKLKKNVYAYNITNTIIPINKVEAKSPQVFLRPHDLVIETHPEGTRTSAKVSRLVHLGWEIEAQLRLDDGNEVKALLTREQFNQLKLKPEQRVYVKHKKAKSFAFNSGSFASTV